MQSVELDIDEQSRIGSTFMAHVAREIRRAVISEKSSRKITQQAIAEKIGTSRAVINREISGVENITSRRIAELLWAIGWEPYFEARPLEPEANEFSAPPLTLTPSPTPSPNVATPSLAASSLGPAFYEMLNNPSPQITNSIPQS